MLSAEERSLEELTEQWRVAIPSAGFTKIHFLEYVNQEDGFWTSGAGTDKDAFIREWFEYGIQHPRQVETLFRLLREYWRRAHGGDFPVELRLAARTLHPAPAPPNARYYVVQRHPEIPGLTATNARAVERFVYEAVTKQHPMISPGAYPHTFMRTVLQAWEQGSSILVTGSEDATLCVGVPDWEVHRQLAASVAHAVVCLFGSASLLDPYPVLLDLYRQGGPFNSVTLGWQVQKGPIPFTVVWDRHRALPGLPSRVTP